MPSHECPAPGCPRAVPANQLACRAHWPQLPQPYRRAIWAAWANGKGAGSAAHRAAVAAACGWYERHGTDY